MFKKPSYVAFTLVLALVLILLNLPTHVTAQLKLTISGLFAPFFGVAGAGRGVAGAAGNALVPRKVMRQQLAQLEAEVQQLKLQQTQFEVVMRENARLRRQVDWQPRIPWRMKIARVVARDPANWYRIITIDLGSEDGVEVNQPVMVEQGLVGRVGAVGGSRSLVVLVGDPKCHVSVNVLDANGVDIIDTGILAPSSASALDTGLVDLLYLTHVENLLPGQRVVTSGIGGVFPKGITVGNIVHSKSVDLGLQGEARVKLSAALYKLEEVWVVWP